MRIAILSTDYLQFLEGEYLQIPGMENMSYEEQYRLRNETLFGTADFYSKNLNRLGHDAAEIYVNNPWLQYAWAREHGLHVTPPSAPTAAPTIMQGKSPVGSTSRSLKKMLRPFAQKMGFAGPRKWEGDILQKQIEFIDPDIILNQSVTHVSGDFLRRFRKPGRLIIGQIASPLPLSETYSAYDFMISSLPNFVRKFREHGLPAALNRLGFEETLLDKLGPQPERDIAISFVGSLSPDHASRIQWLEYLVTRLPLRLWGNGIERLPRSSPLWASYEGEAWGRKMYDVIRRSRVTLNFHIDIAENMANNMRLFEATGMGTALLTDYKPNLVDLFSPGEEVVAYRSHEDCASLATNLISDPSYAATIGVAGQRRTLSNHSYGDRVKEFLNLVEQWRGADMTQFTSGQSHRRPG